MSTSDFECSRRPLMGDERLKVLETAIVVNFSSERENKCTQHFNAGFLSFHCH